MYRLICGKLSDLSYFCQLKSNINKQTESHGLKLHLDSFFSGCIYYCRNPFSLYGRYQRIPRNYQLYIRILQNGFRYFAWSYGSAVSLDGDYEGRRSRRSYPVFLPHIKFQYSAAYSRIYLKGIRLPEAFS